MDKSPTSADPTVWLAEAALVLALLLAYSNSFQGPLIFDDGPAIRDNASIRQLWPLTTVLWPPDPSGRTVDGRPLVNLSVAVNYWVSGLDVWSYHVFNLVVHTAATLILFGLVRKTLLLPRFRERFAEQATGLALTIALVWGLHPLQTESVTYIIQRAESMMGLWYLATLYCVVRGEASEHRLRWHVASFLACLAGMATKEVMVTAPVVVFLYLWVFVFDSWRETLRQRWRLLGALAGTWLLLAALVISQKDRGGSAGFGSQLTVAQYAAMQLPVVLYYLKLSFSPHPLVLDYGTRLVADPRQIIVCGILILLLVASTLWALRRQPWIGFLGSAFFLILSPSSSVVPVLTQTLAEHRMYLPLAAVVALVVMLCFLGWQRLQRSLPEESGLVVLRRLPIALVTLVALLLGLQTWLRNLDYRTGFSIWKDTAEKQPMNARAHAVLAGLYAHAGDNDSALRHSNLAIELNPGDPAPYHTRGTLQLESGDHEGAVADFNKAIENDPKFAEAYQNRGVAQRHLGRVELALADFNRALELDSELRVAYRNRALVLAALNRLGEAQADAREFLERGGAADGDLRRILASNPD
jgi:tetratricopeptide (TPR) repeat protein